MPGFGPSGGDPVRQDDLDTTPGRHGSPLIIRVCAVSYASLEAALVCPRQGAYRIPLSAIPQIRSGDPGVVTLRQGGETVRHIAHRTVEDDSVDPLLRPHSVLRHQQ